MGRRRAIGDEWLPARVYRGRSAFEFRPKNNVCIRLLPLTASAAAVIRRYDEEKAKFEISSGSFAELCSEFFDSADFTKLSPRTQSDYQGNARMVAPVFDHMSVDLILPEHIRQYMDKRGTVAEIRANREHSFMSKVFSWGYERGKVKLNPCHNVRRFSETPRDRYITDEEYSALLLEARPELQALMEISYCCAARQGDVLTLKRSQLLDDGLFIRQGKTNKAQIKRWTERLRSAVRLALMSQEVTGMEGLFVGKGGNGITKDVLRHWVRSAKLNASAKNPNLKFDFTFHDIKAKSISDYEGDKQLFSGHKTAAQVGTYDRKTEIVDSHE